MTVRIGGVPENVNVPWFLAIENQTFSEEIVWIDCPGGTGEMTKLLESGEIDIALALTEGAISYVAKGGRGRIVGTYVESPLIWGVHTANDEIETRKDLRGARFAISRMGSGSHLMSTVYASQNGWEQTDAPRFVIAGGLSSALELFEEGAVDGFLWEKYMTKPLVDSGTLRRIDECVAPWPAFSIVATPELSERRDLISQFIEGAQRSVTRLADDPATMIDEIETRFGLARNDIKSWMNETTIRCTTSVNQVRLQDAIDFMLSIGLLDREIRASHVVDEKVVVWK